MERRSVPDLRNWIERVEEIGEPTRVSGAEATRDVGRLVDLYMQDPGKPALLFDHMRGTPAGPGHRLG